MNSARSAADQLLLDGQFAELVERFTSAFKASFSGDKNAVFLNYVTVSVADNIKIM